jgi:hypothetical protein
VKLFGGDLSRVTGDQTPIAVELQGVHRITGSHQASILHGDGLSGRRSFGKLEPEPPHGTTNTHGGTAASSDRQQVFNKGAAINATV